MKKFSLILLLSMGLILTTSCGIDKDKLKGDTSTEETVEEDEDDEEDTTEEKVEPVSEEQEKESSKDDLDDATLSDADKHAIASANANGNLDYSFLSGKTFKVYGSKFALEWSDEFTISSDGTYAGQNSYGGETVSTYDYSGSFGSIEKISDKSFSIEIKSGAGYLAEGSSVTLYDKGFVVSELPDVVRQWSDVSLYKDIVSGDTLPCQIIYNIEDGSIYAEKSYMAELRPEDNMDTTEASTIEKTPFYGIWCHGTKDEAEADSFAQSVTSNTGIGAQVFVTTDWNNLNTEKFYVVTAGIYATEDSANEYLAMVQTAYPDAYVKYSGDYIGN